MVEKQKELPAKRLHLLAEKSWQLIQAQRMRNIDREKLRQELKAGLEQDGFNLYAFTKHFLDKNVKH